MRTELERRPLVFLFLALVLGLTSISHSWNLIFLPFLFWAGRPVRTKAWLAGGFLVGLGLIPPAVALTTGGVIRAEMTVESPPKPNPFGWTARSRSNGVPIVLAGDTEAPEVGQVLHVSGELKPFPAEEPLAGLLKVKSLEVVQDAPWPIRWADSWRRGLDRLLMETSLNEADRSFLEAICFGSDLLGREELGRAQAEGWLRLVSASGVQVLAVAALLEAVFRIAPVPRPAFLIALTILLGIYALAAGHHASTERAVVAVVLSRWAYMFGRCPDTLSALSLGGVLILLLDPRQVYALGFQMTMLTVGAFAIFGVRRFGRRKGNRFQSALSDGVRSTAIASLAGLPLIAQSLHEISLGGILAVALVVSVVPLLILATFAAQLISLVLPLAGLGLVEAVVTPLSQGARALLDLTTVPNFTFAIPAFSGYVLAAYYGLWLLIGRTRARPA